MVSGENGPDKICAVAMDPLQFGDGRRDEFDFFAAERSGLAGVWIQSGDGDALGTATPDEKILQERPDSHNLGRPQVFGHVCRGGCVWLRERQ